MNNTQTKNINNTTSYNPNKTLKIKGVKRICQDSSKISHDLSSASTKDSFSSSKSKNFRITSSKKSEKKATEILIQVTKPLKAISFSKLANKAIEITKKRDTPRKLVIRSDSKKNLTATKTSTSPLSELNSFDSETESDISLEENDISFLNEFVHEEAELSFIAQIEDDFCSSLNTSILTF